VDECEAEPDLELDKIVGYGGGAATRGHAAAGIVELMGDSSPEALTSVLADLAHSAKDEHEQTTQDDQSAAFEVLGDHLTASGYEAGRRSEEEDE
jgi:hypothetical protein